MKALRMPSPTPDPRTGMLYLNARVPADLGHLAGQTVTLPIGPEWVPVRIGKGVVKRSLGTKDRAEGRIRHAAALVVLEAFWQAQRAAPEPLTHKQRVAFAGEMRRLALAAFDDDPGDPAAWAVVRAVGERLASGALPALAWDAPRGQAVTLAPEDALLARYGAALREVEARHGVHLTPDDRLALVRVAHDAMQDAARINGQKAAGDYAETGETGRYPPLEARKAPAPASPGKAPGTASEWSFGAVIDREEKRRATGKDAKPLAGKTLDALRLRCARFAAHRGSDDVRTVTPREGQAWVDALAEAEKLGGKSIMLHVQAVRTVIGYAQKQSLGEVLPGGDPLKLVRTPVFTPKPGDVSAFREEEARKVLRAARLDPRREVRWLPWLLAHSGARAAEGAGLTREDFFALGRDADGRERWFFRLGGERGEGVKVIASRRTVPVHPALVAEGFLAFVQGSGKGRLFPSNAAKTVGLWVRRGAGVTREGLSPNHGWRHLFEDMGRAAGIPEMALNRITGRTEAGSRAGYGGTDAMLPGLWDQMARIPTLRLDGEDGDGE